MTRGTTYDLSNAYSGEYQEYSGEYSDEYPGENSRENTAEPVCQPPQTVKILEYLITNLRGIVKKLETQIEGHVAQINAQQTEMIILAGRVLADEQIIAGIEQSYAIMEATMQTKDKIIEEHRKEIDEYKTRLAERDAAVDNVIYPFGEDWEAGLHRTTPCRKHGCCNVKCTFAHKDWEEVGGSYRGEKCDGSCIKDGFISLPCRQNHLRKDVIEAREMVMKKREERNRERNREREHKRTQHEHEHDHDRDRNRDRQRWHDRDQERNPEYGPIRARSARLTVHTSNVHGFEKKVILTQACIQRMNHANNSHNY